MAKKKKYEKVTEIVKADSYGNVTTQKLTGNTGGYTRETTPALVKAGQTARQTQTITPIQTIDTTKSFKETQKNLQTANQNLIQKNEDFFKKRNQVQTEAGQEFAPKFERIQDKKLDYQNKQTQPISALPEQKLSEEDLNKKLKKEIDARDEAYRNWQIARYQNDYAKANEEGSNWFDRSLLGYAYRAIPDYFSNVVTDSYKFDDGKGNVSYLPTYSELKNQQADEYNESNGIIGKINKFGGGVANQATKQAITAGLNALTLGTLGSTLYWADMAGDTYKNTKNSGYSDERALAKTTVDTALQFAGTKVLGGTLNKVMGGKAPKLEKMMTKAWNKIIPSKSASGALARMSGEGIEEAAERWAELVTDRFTLDKKITAKDVENTLWESLYEGAAGFATGGFVEGFSAGNTTGNNLENNIPNKMQIVQNLNDVQRQALTEVTIKAKQGIPLDQNDYAVIGAINRDVVNNMVDAQRNQNFGNNLQINPTQSVETNQQQTEIQNMAKSQQNTVSESAANTIENSNNLEYNNTNTKEGVNNEFRELQEASRNISNEEQQLYRRGSKEIDENLRGRLSRVLGQRVESGRSSNSNDARVLTDSKSGNKFEIYDNVDGNTFRDVFEIARTYTRNGELVDLHPVESNDYETGYNDTKNFISKDGLSGFSITKDGDLISVFNANNKRGWLRAIAPEIQKNAKTLDCYMSENQPLQKMYEKAFGFKVASVMDYNMEYDHDDIAKNHNMPQVAFMVKTDKDIETKHFNKDQYDEAEAYRNSLVDKEGTSDSSFSNEILPDKSKKPEEGTKQNKSNSTETIKEIRKEVEEKTNKTMSKHIETSSKATNTVDDIKNMNYDDIVYDEKTHKTSQEQALRELEGKDIDTNINDVHAKFRGTERLTNVDSAKITELMKQTKALADEAAKNNNDSEYNKRMEQFRTLKGDYAVALSESGQFIEYGKVIKELDPETQIDVLKKVIDREKRRGNKKYEDVTINEKLVEKYKKAKTDEERDAIMEEIKDDTARQIKITLVDKLNEFRFLSMLGNFKTHGRNLFGNGGMYSLQSFKDGVAAIGEDIYDKTSKNGLETRSKTLKPATKEVSKYVSDTVDSFMKNQKSKYNESSGMKGDLEGRTKKFNNNNIIGKALNKASNLNSKALDLEDKFFTSKMTKKAMKGFLTANGIETNADIEAHPELVAQALDYALFKGKEATFHQDSTTATAIRNTRDKLYTGSGFSKLGGLAIDATLPFVSTPANIAKNALEYTPIIGFGNINKHLQQAPNNMKANVFIDSLSKQFTGGALMAVGAYLASQGLVKGSGDDDKEDKTEASLGNASYSIKIGNSTYDLSWLAPTAIPFFEGVEVFNAFKKANSKGGIKATDTADLIDTMFGTLNPMTDMSVLQSIERVITSITYGGNAVKSATSTTFSSYLQQYIPTFLSQIAQTGDTKQRNTNTGANVLEKTWDQIKYKIPGARNTLPEKVDVWGNANKTADNFPQRMFEAFLSPANRKDYKVDKTTKELERLARETDDTAMLPTVKNKSLRVNGKDYDLKGKDYVNLQKTYGKTAKNNLDELIKSDSYKNADDAEKQSMVRKIYDYASYKAKEKYAKNKGINFDSGNQTSFAMIDAFEIPYEKYVENKVSGNESATKILDKLNGAALSEVQKGAVMNYFDRAYYVDEDELYSILENSNLSNKQKELIRTKYENNITDKERERYKRADNIGVDYDLYANFRSFVAGARGESRSGGPTKKQKVINWIQEQELTAKQKQNLYNDYINNQGIFSYYK
jgi:hypothetical protein